MVVFATPDRGRIVTVYDDRVVSVQVGDELLVADPFDDVARFAPAVQPGDEVIVVGYLHRGQRVKWRLP